MEKTSAKQMAKKVSLLLLSQYLFLVQTFGGQNDGVDFDAYVSRVIFSHKTWSKDNFAL